MSSASELGASSTVALYDSKEAFERLLIRASEALDLLPIVPEIVGEIC